MASTRIDQSKQLKNQSKNVATPQKQRDIFYSSQEKFLPNHHHSNNKSSSPEKGSPNYVDNDDDGGSTFGQSIYVSNEKKHSPVKNLNTSTHISGAVSANKNEKAFSCQDQQNQLATRIFQSSDNSGDDCSNNDDQSDNGGDSDFEPAKPATKQPLYNQQHSLSYYDSLHTGQQQQQQLQMRADHYGYSNLNESTPKYETDFFTEQTPTYADEISYKLASEEHSIQEQHKVPSRYYPPGSRAADNSDHIRRMRQQQPQQYQNNQSDSSEVDQRAQQESECSDIDEEMMNGDMESTTRSLPSKTDHHQHSANVRRFARNTGTYQASFAKPARQHRLSEEESDEAEQYYPSQNQKRKISSDGEEDMLINGDFTSHQTSSNYNYSYQTNSIEMKQLPSRSQRWSNSSHEISEQTQERLQKQAQLQAMQESSKWVKEREIDGFVDRFKSTGVGFSPQQQLYQNYKESPKEQKIGTFQGWSSRSPDAHFEKGEQMRESDHQQQNQFNKYAMMYPQKSISNETWEQQNRNMGQPLPPSEQKQSQNQKKKKKQATSDTHFLLTGCWSHHNESRSFFRNTGTYDPPNFENSSEGLMKWFKSLTLQDRVNCLTTTFPLFTNSIIDAQHRHVRQNGPLVIFQLKREKSIDNQAEAQGGRRRNPQQEQDLACILERVQGSDESQRFHQLYYADATSCRKFQTKMIQFSRIQHNKKEMDTLTVSQELVKDTDDFFSLVANITDGKAFQTPISFCQKNCSKPLIQSPKWIESKKQNYLGVWIVAILEETLWAHFNFATGFNIPSNCNKNELKNLFEARALKLADPEELAKRWTELKAEGQSKLINQLSQYAKDNPPSKFYSQYEEQQLDRRGNSHYNQSSSSATYNEDLYHNLSRPQEYGLYTFRELPVRSQEVYDRSDYYRTSTQYLDQQGMQTNLNPLTNRSNGNIQMLTFGSHDPDLKDIVDIINYLPSIEVIKYLSEMPLQEINQKNYVRKHNLQAELHKMIQADLRQAIQEKLIKECLEWDLNDEKKSDFGVGQQKDGKAKKNKKSQQQEQRSKKQRQTQQKQQYQKKKSVSKSPPKTTAQKEKVLEKVAQQDNTPKPKQTPEDPQKQPYSRVASTTTSDDQQPSVKPAQQSQQQAQRNQPKNKKKKQPQQESQEQILKHVKAILSEIVDSVCQLEQERQLKLQQEDVVSSESESDQQIVTPTQPDFSDKAEKEPQPGKIAASLEQRESKPSTNAPSETQQIQKPRRRKPKKKPNNIEEQLNNYVRSVCGDIPTTERQEYVPKKQGKDQKKQQQQVQNQKQTNQNQQKGQKQQPQGQKSQQQQQQQQQQQPRREKITPQIAENSGAEEPQPIPFIKHSFVGKPLPEPIGEKSSTTRQSLKKQQMSQSQTQELFSLESSKNAEPFIFTASNFEPMTEVISLEPGQVTEPLSESKTVQISLSEHFGQQLKQENFLQEFKPLDTVFNQQQNQETKKDTFTWVQPTIHVPQSDTMSTTSNAFTPFNQSQEAVDNKQMKVEMGFGGQEPLPITKFNSQTQMVAPQNYYYQQQHQQFQQEPLQKHYSQGYQRQSSQNQYMKQQKQGYQRQYQQQYQKSPPNNIGGPLQQNLFQIPQDQSSGSSGSFQARNTPKNSQFQQQPKNDFYSYQTFAQSQQNEQKVTPQIRIDAPAFQPISENQAMSEDIFSPKESVARPAQPQQQQQQQQQQQWNKSSNFQFQPQNQPYQQPFYHQQEQVPMNHHPLFQRLEETFYQKFDSDIETKTVKIEQVIQQFEDERNYVIAKLQEMADKAFPNRGAVIKVFGSLMTGLALETSDMDIAVTGMRIDSRDDMVDDLHSLGNQVQKWDLIHDFKKHPNASIPVIKAILYMKEIAQAMGREVTAQHEEASLPIDISFDDSPPESQQPQMWHSSSQQAQHDFGGFNQQPMQRMVSQDPMQQLQSLITGELGWPFQNDMSGGTQFSDFSGPPPPKTHLGLASCKLLKDYVKNYPHLKKVAVLLKHFLAVNNLNNAYYGGISSYSAVLLIVAYMNNFNLDQSPNLTPSRLLMGFLDFYSNCFNPTYYGVNTTNKRSFYQLQQVNQHNFIIQDPVNPTNNTARNSFRTPDILSHFHAAFLSLKSQITNKFQQQLAQQEALREQEMARARLVGDSTWAEKASNPLSPQSLSQGEKNQHFVFSANQKSSGDFQASSQEPAALAKAQEQIQPSSNAAASSSATTGAGLSFVPLAQAFDSINFVDCFLSADILKDAGATEKQAQNVEGFSYFQTR